MRTGRYIRTIIAMLMLLMYGAGDVWAQDLAVTASNILIKVMPSDTEGDGSALVNATEGSVSVGISGREVTLTVTPASGYYIKASDIVVEPLAGMDRANVRRRAPGLAEPIVGTLYNHVTARAEENIIYSVTGTSTAYYVFTLPTQYDGAYVTATFTADAGEIRIPGSSITYNANGHYILEDDIAASELACLYYEDDGETVRTTAFTGIFEGVAKPDGTYPKITGATHALFDKINGGTVKNVMLDNVTISSGTNVGVICNEATGSSRIYNCGVLATTSTVGKDNDGYDKITSCSSTISGNGYVGGIVGLLDGSSRVINCFSYANVSGGTHVGGIVGYNNVKTTSANLKTMVMNCMFYGEVSGSSIAPIYNGEIITNDGNANGVNNFNYFRLEASYIQNTGITKKYNCALGAETRFLQRFEFFRHLLNSNRELAAWWATNDTENKDDMAKWVLDKDIAPYPILKKQGKYHSIVNYDPERTYDETSGKMVSRSLYSEANRNKGGTIGSLNVSISGVGSGAPSGARLVKYSLRLVRTDKDDDDYNFNYDKVQLPYYNDVGLGNYTGNKVVTGWKIVSITGGTTGSYSTGDDVTYTNDELTATPYNFADRKCTDKDLYSVSGRVFNQGAYWDVPEGVTSITIEPYWGKAVYLADAYWDVTYKSAMATAVNVNNVGGGQHYTGGTSTFNGQIIHTSISDAISSSNENGLFYGATGSVNHTVYDYAVVLVGNYHHTTNPNADNSKPYTVTSIDLDGDNEPDYSLMLRFNSRTGFHPVRYDFLNLIGLGMAQKTTGGTGSYNLGIMQPKYWFEVTNTALFRVTQFEYSPSGRAKKPIILQGGVIEQWVTQQQDAGDAVEYFHVGGNVWFKEFHRGSHQDNTGKKTPHPPVSVTGGDFNKFYLTGLYQSQAAIYDDNAECYISGGRFGEVAGAGMEGIGTSKGKGNVTWIIDHADIKEFYGGGINYDKPVHGNIHTIIKNSHVTQFCGGPKFGDMESGSTVKTVADNCTFGTYFGAGYGGNSYNRYAPTNRNNVINLPGRGKIGNGSEQDLNSWNDWVSAEYTQTYNSTYKGVSTQIDYQFIPMSSNVDNVARLWVEFVNFSLATTRNVTSSLTGCTITGNFYGGGSLGKVDGTVTSTLTDCSVNGSVFGAGFSGSIPTVEVMNMAFITEPYYYTDLGTYRTAVLPSSTTEPKTTTTYTWQHKDAVNSTETAIDKTNHILYTEEDLTALGTVTGKVTLNIEGNTLVKGNVTENNATTQSGGVFGGGDASAALGDTEVNVEATGRKEGYTYNIYNVFGGGNKADVSGSVVVNMKNGVVDNDVYGGGALANTNTGNAANTPKTTTVNLHGGTVNGDAYGGGLGRKANGVAAVEATVYGDITVNLGKTDASSATAFNISNYTQEGYTSVVKSGRLFGANNLNGSPKGNVTVNVYKTVAGNSSRTATEAYKKKEGDDGYVAPTYEVAAVYGGGNLADYTTTDKKATVNIETCNVSVESVYGGGNAAEVPATEVNVHGAYEIQYVFGGGNGKDPYTLDGGAHWTDNGGANVIGNASTMLTGGFIHEAYGASNEKGTIGGTATLQADDAGDTDCALDVWKMVGAGKNADIIGDVNLILGCMPEAKVDYIYGGADNANVFGNVTLTLTSGNFGKVFGGNNLSGIITGQIILNVEETGCRPINIDALYLGGNQAAYSKFGYYVETSNENGVGDVGENPVLTEGKLTLWPRESADDSHKPVKSINGTTWTVYAGGTTDPYPAVYADPILNVRSFTHIGEVFGGGYGARAVMYANPTVNINQTYGIKSDGNGGYTAKATELGTIDDVYGGGDAAAIEGITTVNIGTEATVDFVTEPKLLGTKGTSLETDGVAYIQNENGTFKTKVVGANITEDVFGGGKLADVRDITNVNICAKENTTTHVYEGVTPGVAGVTIGRNVFGGGKGEAVETGEHAFDCAKAMVGVDGMNADKTTNDSETYANYGTHVRIGHGTVNGSVYGGGEMGRVEFHTEVTIGYGEGTGSTTKSPVINGYVYGAGKGAVTHGYSGLARGNSKLTIQGDAKVGQSVYGGGEKASVGKYEVVDGLPKTPLWGGKCIVTIQGYAEIGPNGMQMVTASGKPDDSGHVFGAGAGILPYENITGTPYSIQPSGKVEYSSSDENDYFKFIRSLGLASNTEVTIGGHAFVKGSVYGGSENGYVQANTHVTIAGGQVGNGDRVNRPYTAEEWAAENTNVLKECAHWPYQSPYAPYDIYKDSNNDGKPDNAGDGHTFYGNVFGGGRGYYPYLEGPELTERQKQEGYSRGLWLRAAGSVGGNTVVDITNGHILTSVYGGNEMTDVTGSCTVNMVGGTVGVPRTVAQMQAHPVTCYVFGAGKGDQRVNFNEQTNVASTQVNISGTARIYGSTFGGGEDGHVVGDAETNIGGDVTIGNTVHHYDNVLIGTTGTSAVDGNIFGGGRGFSESALTAGVVCGDVRVNIHNGKILGTVFGGGRLASVGTYLTAPILSDGSQNPDYGKMQEDDIIAAVYYTQAECDEYNTTNNLTPNDEGFRRTSDIKTPAVVNSSHGHISITIDGGTIGDTDSNNDDKLKESDYTIGDVFGGGKGSSHSSTPGHLRYGEVKTTSITMSGGKVNGSVYGGGENATVEGNTTVTINGGEIGDGKTKKGGAKIGNVYGGGKGSLIDPDDGLIKGNTKITISETDKTNHPTKINHNIYGGGAYGSVGDIHRSNYGANYVPGRASSGQDMPKNMPTSWATGTVNGTAEINILGGQIGTDGDENGMVFGSSRGDVVTPEGATSSAPLGTDVDPNDRTAWVYDTKVVIGASGTTGPDIKGSVYGSGENGHVYNNTDVKIHSGKIGVDGTATITDPVTGIEYTGADYPKRGNVYGGGCGEDDYTIGTTKYYNPMAGIVLGNTKVTVDGGKVVHNIYGGGALGSVGSPNLDTGGKATIEISGGVVGDNGIDDGNVYGASRGNLAVVQANIAQVKETEVKILPANDPIIWNDVFGGGEAGIVIGNVTVNISGGHVYNDVYGGGALANTNTGNWDDQSNLADNAKTKTYYAVSSVSAGDDLTNKGYYKVEYEHPTGTAVEGTTYYEKKGFYNPVDEDEITVGITSVNGYYIEQFVSATEVTAVAGTTYFQKYYYPVDVATGADVTGYYTKTAQDTYVPATGKAEEGTTYYRQTYNPVSGITAGDDLTGKDYYKVEYVHPTTGTAVADVTYYRHEEIYSPVKDISTGDDVTAYYIAGDYTSASGSAEANTLYYKVVTGDWATGKNENNKTTYKTVVNLEGGLIGHSLQGSYGSYTDFDYKGGDVYGGGLGRLASGTITAVEAMVYGDIEVKVDGTAFIQRLLSPSSTENQVPLSGRVFGCNNLNGTPKGNVTVNVNRTIQVVNGARVEGHDENRFEIHSVYGGGNMASYMPADGKKSKVNVYGCDETFIEKVFGGGNSASVPATDVEIFGTGYVGYAFGGGNGADKIWRNGSWNKNGGAPIYGDASIIAHGGKIGQVFSGSDTKGTVYGSATVKLAGQDAGVVASSCLLKITNTYGAGRGADINGDVNLIVSGCATENAIERVFGGSYDANIRGDVNLTITSGIFTQVFGGNDHGGSIGGNINVNIEESDNCEEPTIIQYLYGGGREAIYPGPRARNTSGSSVARGKITVNVKSATRIDNVYGGSYRAQVNGDTEVNINMIKGNMVNQDIVFPETYRGDVIPNVDGIVTYTEVEVTVGTTPVTGLYTCDDETATNKTYTKITNQDAVAEENVKYYKVSMSGTIKDEIGTIGNVFGGSFESYVNGNATVNIGTATTVDILKRATADTKDPDTNEPIPVGTILDTKGKSIYGTDGKMREGITIATEPQNVLGAHITGNVYGGGDNAELIGNTYVNICKEKIAVLDDNDQPTGEYAYQPMSNTTVTSGVEIKGTEWQYGVFGGGNRGVVDGDSHVYLGGGSVMQSIYGGGCEADVNGNTRVEMLGGYVFDGVYGGGLAGSVGTVTSRTTVAGHGVNVKHGKNDCLVGKPDGFKENTGKCTVVVSGGQIGPVEVALADGGMKNTRRYYKDPNDENDIGPVDYGFVFGAGRGDVMSPIDDPDADFYTYVRETDVTISGGLIMASVYGGGENGRVRGNTKVTIAGGQIGCGEGKVKNGKPERYSDTQWANEDPSDFTECASWDYGKDTDDDGKKDTFLPYDPLAGLKYSNGTAVTDGSTTAYDGHTYYGCVFGGGSGYYPYEYTEDGVKKHDWLRSAGMVEGSTKVLITGGHILTSVYGGNETTDVTGDSCVVIMTGGTLGVPRTDTDAQAHPVTCYLFGAGKGDQRTHFNTWTNVQNTRVHVGGTARIFGSVFGGGEDGHILMNGRVDIFNGKIGTKGTSYVDGNVFGGGRGFSGEALTAGSVGGNVTTNIYGGTILGSVYGGGRLASVGIGFVNPTLDDGTPNPDYGLLINDDITPATYYTAEEADEYNTANSLQSDDPGYKKEGDVKTDAIVNSSHGHVTINISGGTIGNDVENAQYGGKVFGGSMGRNTLLNGQTNSLWPKLAVVKLTEVTISGDAVIKKNVYGGGEFGVVRNMATVNVKGGTIHGNVFGGGYGSDDNETKTTITAGGYASIQTKYYTFTPMAWNGCVSGNTYVNVSGGKIYNTVYGGGEMASVGLINFNVTEKADGEFTYKGKKYSYSSITKHADSATGFALSWPYEVEYIAAAPNDAPEVGGKIVGGKATVNITGGRIGIGEDADGDVYGGGKGIAGDRYDMAFCANVRETEVKINYPTTPNASGGLYKVDYDSDESEWQDELVNKDDATTDLIMGSVYGGAENGHVMADTKVTLTNGLIGHAVYGGGKGKTKYEVDNLQDWENPTSTAPISKEIYSLTAGRVYGNTYVTMTGGHVIRTIYGGGNMASVGKGNYAGGQDDYSTRGYGELAPTGTDLWKNSAFNNSGKTTINIAAGTIGFPNSQKDDMPTGNVFGGCRGTAVPNVPMTLSPRWKYCPEFYAGYVNETEVTIGDGSTGPRIYGSVYGGGQDGHVRRSTNVTINKGEIGVAYSSDNVTDLQGAYSYTGSPITTAELAKFGDPDHFQWRLRGNVFGGGSGLGMYDTGQKDDNNNKIKKISTAAGSVTDSTTVTINTGINGSSGGVIYRNVYGGGSLGTVGPPKIYSDQDYPTIAHTLNTVTIKGTIGDGTNYNSKNYGGYVYGASRGANDEEKSFLESGKESQYSTAQHTIVEIDDASAKVYRDVYGGGEAGDVGGSVVVNMKAGEVGRDLYGGGALASTNTNNWNFNNYVEVTGLTVGESSVNEYYTRSGAGTTESPYKYSPATGSTAVANTTYYKKEGTWVNATAKSWKNTTKVNLLGGKVTRDVYGGGLGRKGREAIAAHAAVNYNATDAAEYNAKLAGAVSTSDINPNTQTNYTAEEAAVYNATLTGAVSVGDIQYPAVAAQAAVSGIAAYVYGNILVELNNNNNGETADGTKLGCIVGRIFGCNNLNGTPKGRAKVHVYATQNANAAMGTIRDKFAVIPALGENDTETSKETMQDYLLRLINAAYIGGDPTKPLVSGITESVITAAKTVQEKASPTDEELTTAVANVQQELDKVYNVRYDVQAVYGGANLAPYDPADAYSDNADTLKAARTEVIIDGCQLTSIYQVYAGGNAASTPATYLRVNGTYEIAEVFGGGNGNDDYQVDGIWYENPGANVGYGNYTHNVFDGTQGNGAVDTPFKAIDNSDASSKELRQANYSYGSGIATTEIAGGRIHVVYGGSNKKGNIATTALSVYEGIDDSCPLKVDETYGAGKDAPQDGEVNLTMDCVRDMKEIFGGAKNANVYADVKLRITNGSHFEKVFGGNNTSGAIAGSITVDVEEEGCEPIMIQELYAGGYLAPYSIYGYIQNQDGSYVTEEDANGIMQIVPYDKETFAVYKSQLEGYIASDLTKMEISSTATETEIKAKVDAIIAAGEGTTSESKAKYEAALDYISCKDIVTSYPKRNPNVNIISATKIDNIFGGGYKALVVGTPHINVNMTTGKMEVKQVNTGTETDPVYVYKDVNNVPINDTYKVNEVAIDPTVTPTPVGTETKYFVGLPLGKLGNIYGGGNMADIYGNTHVEIGTGKHHNMATGEVETITPARNDAVITGNVYGGGRMGHVGEFRVADATYHTSHSDVPVGKPYACLDGTGTCNVTISNGSIGPDDMAMFHLDANGNIPTDDKPDNFGHVFGGGMGTNEPADFDKAFVNKTEVTIDGTAFVKGSVFGGGENGHVLNDTHVIIDGDCQIGNGHIFLTEKLQDTDPYGTGTITVNRGLNRPYTAEEWAAGHLIVEPGDFPGLSDDQKTAISTKYNASLPECDSWLFGKTISAGKVVASDHHAPHDILANKTGDLDKYSDNTTSTEGGRYIASDGRAFNGNVYGGGSGYFPYEPGKWLDTAGQVEGNTTVEVKGGHILTSLFGGCEMTSVLGNTYVTMSGGTLGVPRTLAEIAAHPVTCYVFGGGKGEGRSFLNSGTNVQDANVTISGGWVYGSVFGGAEDGHVLGNAIVTIEGTAVGPTMTDAQAYAAAFAGEATKIGTWGTSYVDGNIFGGGRGFDGINLFAGTIGGNTKINITGGTMLGSIYGGGRMASVGADFSATSDFAHHGHLKEDEGGKTYGYSTINISGGTIGKEFTTNVAGAEHSGNVFGGSMGRLLKLDGVNYLDKWPQLAQVKTATVNISGNPTIYRSVYGGGEFGSVRDHAYVTIGGTLGADKTTVTPVTTGTPIIHHNVFGGGYGSDIRSAEATKVVDIVDNSGETPTTIHYIFTPMIWAGCVGKTTNVNICGGHILRNVYGGGEMASVGVIDYTGVKVTETPSTETDDVFVNVKDGNVVETWKYNNIVKNHDTSTSFALSWPYKITKDSYLEDFPGVATVNITGGRIGITGKDWFGAYETDDNGQYVQVQEKDANGNPILDSNNVPVMRKIRVREDNGDVFGGGMGIAGDRYEYAACANVKETHVNINLTTPDDDKIDILKSEEWDKEEQKTKEKYSLNLLNELPGIAGSVYGGAENGHVWADANVDITGGYIGHAVYGGGKGKGTYEKKLWRHNQDPSENPDSTANIYSVTAGRVFGNTKITMSGGHVMRNIYGGGNMGSVGKGSYAGGPDDYSTSGYGEKLATDLWKNDDFINSGKTDVSITGGTVGFLLSSTTRVMQIDNSTGSQAQAGTTTEESQTLVGTASSDYALYAKKVCSKDDLPTGNVFGGCRGEAARSVPMSLSPRYYYCPEYYAGFSNETSVTIGDANAATGPRLYGSVYGGGQDGHVRRSTNVIINKGEIGLAYDADLTTDDTKNVTLLGTSDLDNLHWLHRGNVYGSGSGMGKYDTGKKDDKGKAIEDFNNSSGSVTCNTTVTIGGDIDGVAGTQASPGNVIYRNVYGGGSLASVGAPQISQPDVAFNRFDPAHATDLGRQSGCQVNILGFIGPKVGYSEKYGGEVYGGSRGMIDKDDPDKFASFATTIWTQVNIKDGATIMGNVFGGGDAGAVKKDTDVRIGDE